MLENVRQPLLAEARKSPTLLSDLAGLEKYIAESYDARSFVELLQNADDADASRFLVQRNGDFLLVANDGRPFSQTDFESLCRSAASSKSRGSSIGYRGIGFKSVVGFAEEVHIFSGPLEATFSRTRTAQKIPEATRVPLIRIPHPVEANDRSRFATPIDRLIQEGFTTIFVFADLIASGIEAEFNAFDPSSLLFLKHIRQVELRATVEAVITARRETIDSRTRAVRLASSNGVSRWTIFERDGIALGFTQDETGIKRLDEIDAVVHAFLPTLEATGFSIKINGDISTDPSRTRIVFDERTAAGIDSIARLIVDLVDECLTGDSPLVDEHLMAALIPLTDPRMAIFQRHSFKTELFASIQRTAKGRFTDLRYRPTWLNAVDFEKTSAASHLRVIPRKFGNIEGLSPFLSFLGASEATLTDLSNGLEKTVPSMAGAAEVVAHITNRHTTKQIQTTAINANWRLWPVDGIPQSLREVKTIAKPLDRDFTDLVAEKVGASTQLARLVSELTDPAIANAILPSSLDSGSESLKSASVNLGDSDVSSLNSPAPHLSLKKWRSAEQQVLTLLHGLGWQVEDVSRQNIGYDIEGYMPDGEAVSIEVKAIDNPGQAFILTSNEEAVARQKGAAYRIAIVRQTNTHLEIAFIKDPIKQLNLTRQCRQWVWECASYDFTPERFPLE